MSLRRGAAGNSFAPFSVQPDIIPISNRKSCIYYYKLALTPDDSLSMYEASRKLFRIYDSQGNKALALDYAREFIDICIDLDLGRRQELAATVNNLHKYYKNREVEDRLQKERDNLRVYLWIVLTLSLLMTVAAFIGAPDKPCGVLCRC